MLSNNIIFAVIHNYFLFCGRSENMFILRSKLKKRFCFNSSIPYIPTIPSSCSSPIIQCSVQDMGDLLSQCFLLLSDWLMQASFLSDWSG